MRALLCENALVLRVEVVGPQNGDLYALRFQRPNMTFCAVWFGAKGALGCKDQLVTAAKELVTKVVKTWALANMALGFVCKDMFGAHEVELAGFAGSLIHSVSDEIAIDDPIALAERLR